MRVALRARASGPAYASAVVVDAATTLAEDLFEGEDRRADVDELVRGQLGMVLALGGNEASVLLDTLEAYLESGCNKTRTADRLHLQRQSLYARLDRVFALVGGDPTGTPRALPLHLALRLRHGRHFTVG
jgi:purine catabolism regulator